MRMKKKTFIFIVVFAAIFAAVFCGCEKKGDEAEVIETTDGYVVVKCEVMKGDAKIYGELYVPSEKKDSYPLVILSHSAFMKGRALKAYAAGFAERGFMAYTFDFCGGGFSSKSDGDMKDMTIFTEKDDLNAVIDHFRGRNDVKSEKIFLCGTSQGGLVSALVANDRNDDIAGLILMYPAFNVADQVNDYDVPEGAENFLPVGKEYFDTLKDFDVFAHIGNFKKPVVIIHGTRDTTVPISYSERAAEVYENCVLRTISGGIHGFNPDNYSIMKNYDTEVWKYIDEYLQNYSTK